MYAPRHMIEHPRPECLGDAALLVLVDSRGSYSDTCVVDETILIALHHFGMPFRLHDMAAGSLSAQMLAECAAVVVAQARMGESLTAADATQIASAVREEGMGFVSFDGDLARHQPPLLGLFGLEVDPLPLASDLLRIGDKTHDIIKMQKPGDMIRLHRPITFAQIRSVGPHVAELAQAVLGKDQLIFARHHLPGTAYEPGHHPAVLAAAIGRGRVVQFTCSPRLWHRDFLGHGMGLDGLFWRSLVWAARKPFVAQMMPPFVTLRVDDASGRHELEYAKVMVQNGHRPIISCFLNRIPDRVVPLMQTTSRAGTVDWDAHALDYYELIPFKFGVGEYTDDELATVFGRLKQWYAERDLRAPETPYFHWGEIGVRALPYIFESGRRFVYSVFHPGQLKWERFFPNWWPFGLNGLFYDYIPEYPALYNIGAGLPRHVIPPDVLTGCTVWAGENPVNDMAKAADRSAQAVRLALDSGFFAEMITHEQKFAALTLEEIDHWLSGLSVRIEGYEPRLVGHEEAAERTKARDESWISAASRSGGSGLSISMAGEAGIPQELALFDDDGDGVVRRWTAVPTFSEEIEIEA